jgi:hypothetical protein
VSLTQWGYIQNGSIAISVLDTYQRHGRSFRNKERVRESRTRPCRFGPPIDECGSQTHMLQWNFAAFSISDW